MKKVLMLIIVIVMLSSCTTIKYFINSGSRLVSVNSNIELGGVSLNEKTYTDDYVSIILDVENVSIDMTIINHYNSSIRVLWDEAAYIDNHGNAHRVIHLGVKFIDKEKTQVPSVIPSGAHIEDMVVPVDCIEWIDGEWEIHQLDYNEFSTMELAEIELNKYKEYPQKSSNKLLLPIEIDGEKIEYTMEFVGDDFSIQIKEVPDAKKTSDAYWIGGLLLLSLLSLLAI